MLDCFKTSSYAIILHEKIAEF